MMTSSTSVSGYPSSQKPETLWHAAYPAPKNADPASVHRTEVLEWFHNGEKPGVDFVIVDPRRIDHEVSSH